MRAERGLRRKSNIHSCRERSLPPLPAIGLGGPHLNLLVPRNILPDMLLQRGPHVSRQERRLVVDVVQNRVRKDFPSRESSMYEPPKSRCVVGAEQDLLVRVRSV